MTIIVLHSIALEPKKKNAINDTNIRQPSYCEVKGKWGILTVELNVILT